MPNFFTQQRGRLNLAAQESTPNQGFRAGQLGALHAVLAHLSVSNEPAIVCLPTGYGKTSVMMALPLLMAPNRVLVVEPSDALRRQVSSHFQELSTLRRIGAIPQAIPNPTVLRHEGRPVTAADWDALAENDVVVSTPGSSSPSVAPGSPSSLFDLIIFDEAHHAPAETWAAFLEHYKKARFIFLTATPFRRDGRVIPGKLIYRYPVMRAVDEGAFQPVAFHAAPVQNTLDNDHVDRVIAETAVAQLRADTQAGYDHRLFVRASSINAARLLVPVYRSLGVEVEAVDSKLSKRRQEDCERRLISGELQGIVCVDMFGEGYDFPKLKVAALHAPHRSLVPTIQFIGRFARVDATTGQATLIAPMSRVQDANSSLLREGVNIARMIDEAALEELAGDADEQAVLERLPVKQVAESDYEAVSPLALQLYAHVRVFHCSEVPDFALIGETVGRQLRIVKQWSSEDGAVSLVLTTDENPPNWATSNVLVNLRHDAFLLVYFPSSRHCYIGSTRRTEKIYLGLMDKVCEKKYRALSYEETSRARAGLQSVRFYNVGLKNTTLNSQAETYRTLTGPAAERAVTAGDGRAYSQGHFFGSGMIGNDKETIGASSSSRIWSNQRLTVAEFLDWVERINTRLVGTTPFAETQLDIVRAATTLRQVPDLVIAATWSRVAFKLNPKVRYRKAPGAQFFYRRLTDMELTDFKTSPNKLELLFKIVSDNADLEMRFAIGQGRMTTLLNGGFDVELESATDSWMLFSDWLCEHPPLFYSADKSSFEGMNLMSAPRLQAVALGPDDMKALIWTGCDVTVEFVPNNGSQAALRQRQKLAGQLTVQEYLEQHLLTLPNLVALFYDHRTGEAADYIAVISTPTGEVEVALYHCKAAGGQPSGGRVGDVYEVAGQLVKSVSYCDVATLLDHIEDRMDHRHASPSRFVRGDLPMLRTLLTSTSTTKLGFAVIGVQPGIRQSLVGPHLADLMAFGINYARQGGATRAYWLISP
ncbi:DEAD/DEAH box helicase [Dyella dinghuensis]|uniref:DEAD/DEAH box helicase n=1 Tax=Dyella dinghuensis TaxID=1920169 RepID=A0A3S0RCJ5_9GAMM|nr:DEAD/DEAH box helicase family protein [Dyella dinghuensis]RUL62030.1 DEAD/DEAH box helicase [Dyella dinghuensis]